MKNKDVHRSWLNKIKLFVQNIPTSNEDLIKVFQDAQERAVITPEIQLILESTILFSQMRARDIMLPKNQIEFINAKADLLSIIQLVTQSGHSRFPVTEDNLENVIGILHAKDLLSLQLDEQSSFNLLDICREPLFIPESKRLDILLREFRHNKNHMAIVVDEYGYMSGFITIEDIIEQIVGDIEDEFDIDKKPSIRVHADSHYIIKAQMPIDALNAQLNTQFNDDVYDTIGGIVMKHFGHLPSRGEKIIIDNFEFIVLNADARHIKLLECIDKRHAQTESKP